MTPASLLEHAFIKHVAVGLIATVSNYAMLMVLLWFSGEHYIFWSALVANLTGTVVAFGGNYLWVHQSGRKFSTSFMLFVAAYSALAVARSAALTGFYSYILANVTVVFLIVTAITAIMTYNINKRLVFSVRR